MPFTQGLDFAELTVDIARRALRPIPGGVSSDSTRFGLQEIVVATVPYTLKDITVTRPSNRILSKGALGRPKKKVLVARLVAGTTAAKLEN